MSLSFKLCLGPVLLFVTLFLVGCQGLTSGSTAPSSGSGSGTGTGTGGSTSGSGTTTTPPPPVQMSQLTVTSAGVGSGTVTSDPAGISCPGTCAASFNDGTQVTLTATPATGFSFSGWSGACTGTGTCAVTLSADSTVTGSFGATLQSIQHVIFMLQENRSFDHYFGAMRQYWAKNGYPDQSFDGLPQFNPTSGAAPFQASPPTNPGCDPAFPFNPAPAPVQDCTIDANSPLVPSFHIISQCTENPSPSWDESHADYNLNNSTSGTATLDGFVWTAGHDSRHSTIFNDTNGVRAMSYFTGDDLPYYYFMASNFATSDRWFSPVMSRTQVNRMYAIAATSAGHAYPLPKGSPQLKNKTIFELAEDAGLPWKVYVTDDQNSPLINGTDVGIFAFSNSHQANFVSATQFAVDAQNNTLPAVAVIEPGFAKGLDEHPGEDPNAPSGKIQAGAAYVASLINALMNSPSWKNSVFILSWDEFGGFYDHYPPQPMPSPDGIAPVDLKPGDICTTNPGATCDFQVTGYRVPLIVISPYTKKNYVSHTVADYTAILKFIETRFNLPSLNNRDAAQMDMTEFFDFVNAPWMTPPTPPTQPNNLPCEYTTLQ